MTCKEKLVMESPGSVGYAGTPYGCPSDHGYLANPDYCEWPFKYAQKCLACWNREIPENNKTEKEKQEVNENTWTPPTMPEIEGPRTRTSREIEEEMLRLRAEHYDRMTALAKELEEVKKIEALEEAAAELKRVVDAYVKAGFTREEAMSMILIKIKEN